MAGDTAHSTEPQPVVLVTSGRSLMGYLVIQEELQKGHKVIAVSSENIADRDEYAHIPLDGEQQGEITWIKMDSRAEGQDVDAWRQVIAQHGITRIAECSGVFNAKPPRLNAINRDAPLALARAAAESGQVERYVQLTMNQKDTVPNNRVLESFQERVEAMRADPVIMDRLNWVDIATGHFYSTKLGSSFLPHHIMAAAMPAGFNLTPDTVMQPINAEDLARGVSNLLANDTARGQTIRAFGPEEVRHNEILHVIRRGLGLPEEMPKVTIPHVLARKLGQTAALFSLNIPGWSIFPGMSGDSVDMSLHDEKGDPRPFMEAAGLERLQTVEESYHAEREPLLAHLKERNLLQLLTEGGKWSVRTAPNLRSGEIER